MGCDSADRNGSPTIYIYIYVFTWTTVLAERNLYEAFVTANFEVPGTYTGQGRSNNVYVDRCS